MKPLKLRAAHAATLCLAIIGSIQPLQVFAQKTQPSEAAQISGATRVRGASPYARLEDSEGLEPQAANGKCNTNK